MTDTPAPFTLTDDELKMVYSMGETIIHGGGHQAAKQVLPLMNKLEAYLRELPQAVP